MPAPVYRLARLWNLMRWRCDSGHPRYGGRGIKICSEWRNFDTFYDWAITHGYQDHLSIDRIDNDGDYEPSNCRWVPRRDQLRNTSKTMWVHAFDERKPLTAWAEDPRCVVSADALRYRLKAHWEPEQAITTPLLH